MKKNILFVSMFLFASYFYAQVVKKIQICKLVFLISITYLMTLYISVLGVMKIF